MHPLELNSTHSTTKVAGILSDLFSLYNRAADVIGSLLFPPVHGWKPEHWQRLLDNWRINNPAPTNSIIAVQDKCNYV